MKKYFKEEQPAKISLLEYKTKIEKECKRIKEEIKKCETSSPKTGTLIYQLKKEQEKISLLQVRIDYIYSSLGDVRISEDMINTICETFDSSRCRYGTICLKKETIKDIYEISLIFPELSKEAILSISREYISDLFKEYSLIEKLAIMIRKDGMEDSTFEKYMAEVSKLADKKDKEYEKVAASIRMYCGEYTYDFVRHFEKFVKEHHISFQRFYECLPSPELIMQDQLQLKQIAMKAKDCFGICDPITFQMLEDYLDGDVELSKYEEQPAYYISTYGGKIETSFTKKDFIESIEEKQKTLKIK